MRNTENQKNRDSSLAPSEPNSKKFTNEEQTAIILSNLKEKDFLGFMDHSFIKIRFNNRRALQMHNLTAS